MSYGYEHISDKTAEDTFCCRQWSLRTGVKLCWLFVTTAVFHSIAATAVLQYMFPAFLFLLTIPFYFTFTLGVFRKKPLPLIVFAVFLIIYLVIDMIIAIVEVLRAFEIMERFKNGGKVENTEFVHDVPSHFYNVVCALLSMMIIVWCQFTLCRYYNYLNLLGIGYRHEDREDVESIQTTYSIISTEKERLMK